MFYHIYNKEKYKKEISVNKLLKMKSNEKIPYDTFLSIDSKYKICSSYEVFGNDLYLRIDISEHDIYIFPVDHLKSCEFTKDIISMKIDSSKYEVYLNYFSKIHDYMVRIINRDGNKLLCNYVINSNHLSSKKSRIKEKLFTDNEFAKIKSDIKTKLLLIDLAG